MTKKAKEEIERKWLLPRIPRALINMTPALDLDIFQAYPWANGFDFRIRHVKDRLKNVERCFMTIKENGHLARKEWEKTLDLWAYETLLPLAGTHIIHKIRTGYKIKNHLLELDVYQGQLEGLIILEVEFKSKKAATNYALPRFIGRTEEVTNNPAYKNYSLAVKGLPSK